ncbi:hypothetical protein O9G_000223 [Rozella allomycis CSF55]|uniref:CCHC-type domain-containing protein n=1 Tax=Rozella allomycis (strain CSF55) TaxID=988480 RepID=A0A075AP56_ROZAC|nr:hypothetical protein O9G_000223 [Rozella allomycis CSF55]|eukprot:EPZ31744.1 hypothetical protein O9G_000223 [Rozella allomycis CSF55]
MKINNLYQEENEPLTDSLRRYDEVYNEFKNVGGKAMDYELVNMLNQTLLTPNQEKLYLELKFENEDARENFHCVRNFLSQVAQREEAQARTTELRKAWKAGQTTMHQLETKEEDDVAMITKQATKPKDEETRWYTGRCYVCDETGHRKFDCPLWKKLTAKENGKARREAKPKEQANMADEDSSSDESEIALIMRDDEEERTMMIIESENEYVEWIVDSGATSHMSSHRELFENNVEKKNARSVSTAGTETMKIEGSGEIPLRVKNSKGEIKEVRLYNVLHVPSMNSNLMSIPKLLKNPEITVIMEQEMCSVRRRECEIMRGKLERQLFTIKTMKRETRALNVSEKTNEMDIWHRRLGHVCESYLRQMSKIDVVEGIPLFKENKSLSFCHTCAKHKARRAPFKGALVREMTIGAKLHTDIMGPMEKETILTMIDDHSRKCFIHLIPKKSDAKDKRSKLDGKAEIHYLVGYGHGHRMFRVRVGKTNKVKRTKHVRFIDENEDENEDETEEVEFERVILKSSFSRTNNKISRTVTK